MNILTNVLGELGWMGILAGTLAYFMLGALWFAPFAFGKLWNKAIGFEKPVGWKFPLAYYIGPLFGCFIATVATATIVRALKIETSADAMVLGLIAGVGYAASVSFVNAIMPKIPRPFLYGTITGAYHVTGIVLAALVIVAMN